jgi:hypothetical protein
MSDTFECKHCKLKYKTQINLNRHVEKFHSNVKEVTKKVEKEKPTPEVKKSKKDNSNSIHEDIMNQVTKMVEKEEPTPEVVKKSKKDNSNSIPEDIMKEVTKIVEKENAKKEKNEVMNKERKYPTNNITGHKEDINAAIQHLKDDKTKGHIQTENDGKNPPVDRRNEYILITRAQLENLFEEKLMSALNYIECYVQMKSVVRNLESLGNLMKQEPQEEESVEEKVPPPQPIQVKKKSKKDTIIV